MLLLSAAVAAAAGVVWDRLAPSKGKVLKYAGSSGSNAATATAADADADAAVGGGELAGPSKSGSSGGSSIADKGEPPSSSSSSSSTTPSALPYHHQQQQQHGCGGGCGGSFFWGCVPNGLGFSSYRALQPGSRALRGRAATYSCRRSGPSVVACYSSSNTSYVDAAIASLPQQWEGQQQILQQQHVVHQQQRLHQQCDAVTNSLPLQQQQQQQRWRQQQQQQQKQGVLCRLGLGLRQQQQLLHSCVSRPYCRVL